MKIILIVTAAFFAMLSVAAAADLPIGKYPVGAAARPAPARPGAFGPGERGGGRVAPEGVFGGGVTGGLPGGVVSGGRAPVAPEQPECPIAEGAGEKPPAGVAHGEEREAGGGGAPEHTLRPPADGQPGCALARFVGSIGLAAAQQPTPPADAQQQSQQEKAQQTPSGKMGAEEPSSHTPNAKPQENAVFVNGALAGAPANTDTVPAKFSKKNAADDELITVAYTFKTPVLRLQRGCWNRGAAGDRAAPGAQRGRRARAANQGLSIYRGERSRAAGGDEPDRGRRLCGRANAPVSEGRSSPPPRRAEWMNWRRTSRPSEDRAFFAHACIVANRASSGRTRDRLAVVCLVVTGCGAFKISQRRYCRG